MSDHTGSGDVLGSMEKAILADLRDPSGLALVNTQQTLGYDSLGGPLTESGSDSTYCGLGPVRDSALTGSVAGEAPENELPVEKSFSPPPPHAPPRAAASALAGVTRDTAAAGDATAPAPAKPLARAEPSEAAAAAAGAAPPL
jgi:hypothetical protein